MVINILFLFCLLFSFVFSLKPFDLLINRKVNNELGRLKQSSRPIMPALPMFGIDDIVGQ